MVCYSTMVWCVVHQGDDSCLAYTAPTAEPAVTDAPDNEMFMAVFLATVSTVSSAALYFGEMF